MSNNLKASIAAFTGNFIFGLSFLFSDIAFTISEKAFLNTNSFSGADVPAVLATRFLFALVLMTIVMVVKGIKIELKGKPVCKLILLGIFQPIVYFIGESFGLKATNIIVSSVIIALVPVISQIFSSVFLKEKPTLSQSIFCIVSVLGVIWVTCISSQGGGETYFYGIICLCVAVLCAVGFNALGRSISATFTPFERTYFMFVDAAVFFGIYALIGAKGNAYLILSPLKNAEYVFSILYLGGLSSVVAFLMINYANTYLPITKTTVFTNIITVVSSIAGFIASKSFEPMVAVGCLVIIIGVWGVQIDGKKPYIKQKN